ncbi:MAG TPA: flagellar biosynthesis protein FlhA [Candidatus Limnocylindrales bacterium]
MTTATPAVPVLRRSDAILAGAVVGIVAMMIIPLPSVLLDILIVLNITFSLTILLVALNIREPLEFSSFPPLLLIATLFRLGLNVSAARLILLNAHAGDVISAFGKVVVGGNTIVGIVVFLILVVIQYVVITNGAGRVSEVSARFTLDAMPGKQMSIDADLNAGLITPDDARLRRRAIEREADFYGSMDGASKFVKGDAVAALVIIVVNIVGGLTVGVLQKGFDIGQALTTYTVLTVGDGLVNEISALLISIATGILVTRSGSDVGLGSDFGTQLLGRPKLFMVVGAALVMIGLVPGFPIMVFGIGGGVVFAGGYFLSQSQTAAAVALAAAGPVVLPSALPALGAGTESPLDALKVETMELEVGYGLVGLVEGGASGGLVERIGLIRRQIASEMGLIVPTVRIRDDLVLDQNAYVIKLRGSEIARGTVDPTKMLCMDPNGGEIAVSGIPTTEPVFGLPASWVSIADRERSESLGYTVVDAASVLATHLAETIRRHAHEILGRPETNQLLEGLKRDQPGLVEELVPVLVSMGDVEKVLQGLLRERVPIRDLSTILESVADAARSTKEPLFLTEAVRHALSRAISMRYRAPDGAIHAVALAPDLDTRLGTSVMVQPGYVGLELSGSDSRLLIESIDKALKSLALQRYQPILLCTTRIRLALRNLTERHLPQLTVLSYEEILPSVSVQVHAQVEV